MNLLVESVGLTRIDHIAVPLTFLSETPGQLTVSNMHVIYDLPKSPMPTWRPASTISIVGKTTLTSQPPETPRSRGGAVVTTLLSAASNTGMGTTTSQVAAISGVGEGAAAVRAVTPPDDSPMENTSIRMLLKTIARESSTLRLLRDDPQKVQQKFSLTDDELNALRSADLLHAGELHISPEIGQV